MVNITILEKKCHNKLFKYDLEREIQFTKNWSKSFPNNLDWNQLQAQYMASVYVIEDYKVKHRSPFPAWAEQLSEYGCYASTGELLVQILLGSLLGFETQAIYNAPGGF